jgi:hypothetical protein
MSDLFIHNVRSLAWEALYNLTDRPQDILMAEWGVHNGGSGSSRERHLHGYGKTLTLTLETERNEISAKIKEFGRVRRFEIGSDQDGRPLLKEQGGEARSVHHVLDDLVEWLKEPFTTAP